MNIMKKTLLASAVSAAALLAASAASAQVNYDVTSVSFDIGALNLQGVPGGSSYGGQAGLILLNTSNHGVIPTFCVDLFHAIGNQAYSYTQAPLKYDSSSGLPGLGGISLTTAQIGEIGYLADKGVQDYWANKGSTNEYIALQGAIWNIEYGVGYAGNGQITTDIGNYVTDAQNNPLYTNVWSVIPGVNGQNPYLGVTYSGQALVTAPGPKLGEGLLGFAAMTALLIGARYRGLFV
jgi:hypothetical protein